MKHCIDCNYIGNKCFIGKSANFHVIDANEGCSSSSFRWDQFEIRNAHHKSWFCVNIVAMNMIWLGLRIIWEIISFNYDIQTLIKTAQGLFNHYLNYWATAAKTKFQSVIDWLKVFNFKLANIPHVDYHCRVKMISTICPYCKCHLIQFGLANFER